MKVIINDTIEAFWNSLSITGMQSPERRLINQSAVPRYVVLGEGKNKVAIRSDGEIEYIEGDAGVLETTIYGKDEDLVKLFHIGEITCKCDNGMVFKGIIKEFSTKTGVSGAMDITMQLYRL
jgi:hypothetical protein